MNSFLTRSGWLRNLDWFILSALVIIIVAKSSGLIDFQTRDDSHFISFLVVCIFFAIVMDVVGSVLWMIFTISTDPFVVDPDEISPSDFFENPGKYEDITDTYLTE